MLKLYNTMSRSQETFKPRNPDAVKVFTCGPSVYQRPHIGNYRTFIYEDILVKYLEYTGYSVERAIPLTDIEDKAIQEARIKKRKVEDITGDVVKIFKQEARALKIRLPRKTQRSSQCITCVVDLLQELLKKGHAYYHGTDIFFDPLTFKEFGKLFRLDMSQWPDKKVRFKKDTYTGNRWNRGDFILWHGCRPGDISCWDTEIGRGRPSWNIQDPSVIIKHLGPEIDINCGGIDNMYRHHDYNIAILESFSRKKFACYYLHGEHLIVRGKTMSKSRGNIVYPDEVYTRGYRPYHLRFFLLYTHYREKLNFTEDEFAAQSARIDDIRGIVRRLTRQSKLFSRGNIQADFLIEKIGHEFTRALDSDLAAGKGIDAVFSILKQLERLTGPSLLTHQQKVRLKEALTRIDTVLGVLL